MNVGWQVVANPGLLTSFVPCAFGSSARPYVLGRLVSRQIQLINPAHKWLKIDQPGNVRRTSFPRTRSIFYARTILIFSKPLACKYGRLVWKTPSKSWLGKPSIKLLLWRVCCCCETVVMLESGWMSKWKKHFPCCLMQMSGVPMRERRSRRHLSCDHYIPYLTSNI